MGRYSQNKTRRAGRYSQTKDKETNNKGIRISIVIILMLFSCVVGFFARQPLMGYLCTAIPFFENKAMDSTCPVCGNISMTPALTN